MPMGQPRAEKTRNAILAAAEELFAERGFDATRLEDIAERVGIRRASIVYYFKEKREVYDAIIADVLHGLHGTLEQALTPRPAKPLDRVEAIVAAWANYVGGRPATARLLLREIERDDFQVLHQRIRLTPLRKFWLAWKVQAPGRM